MNKNIVGAGVAIVALLAIGGVVIANKPDKTNTASSTTQSSSNSNMNQMDMQQGSKSATDGTEEDLTGQTEVTMDIQNFAFAKKSIKISKGTKVVWTNQDDVKHNVFSKDSGGPQGKLLAQGETFEYTFDTAGTFNYICEPHPYMKGVVSVVE